ncbi:MAG: bifunctional phosphopantothenoylcysteine decarboxylase/phosphopantothenate--cysteine ligase CoaBC [Chitinophagaceae bacterium]
MLKGKRILLAVTGSIAAYKSILLVRLFVKAGAEVKVIMTAAAKDFVSPLTISTLSGNEVMIDLFEAHSWANHVMLGRWADVMIIAPLSCNTLSKMAHGACDNLLLATYLSSTCPVVVAPAMDEDMWQHATTKQNIKHLENVGNHIIPVDNGSLASGLIGDGRMAEPEAILEYISTSIFRKMDLEGKRVLVTAGPTYEAIDPVRFIGNHSSGKMGLALTRELVKRGAVVNLVLGPSILSIDHPNVHTFHVKSANEMYDACLAQFDDNDIAIMSAAVADYTPISVATNKIKKKEDTLTLELIKTKDILQTLGKRKKNGQFLVGFALETNNERENALIKLSTKQADMLVLNSLNDQGAGFGHDTNRITIYEKNGSEIIFDKKPKELVARDIVDTIITFFYA